MTNDPQKNGGLANVARYGKSHMREIVRRGGMTTANRYGPEYMRNIGKKGAAVFYQRYDLQPIDTYQFAVVEKDTRKIIAIR